MDKTLKKVPKSVHTRQSFAMDMALRYLKTINHNVKGGNILTGKATIKFMQCLRIYYHYRNVYITIGKIHN